MRITTNSKIQHKVVFYEFVHVKERNEIRINPRVVIFVIKYCPFRYVAPRFKDFGVYDEKVVYKTIEKYTQSQRASLQVGIKGFVFVP